MSRYYNFPKLLWIHYHVLSWLMWEYLKGLKMVFVNWKAWENYFIGYASPLNCESPYTLDWYVEYGTISKPVGTVISKKRLSNVELRNRELGHENEEKIELMTENDKHCLKKRICPRQAVWYLPKRETNEVPCHGGINEAWRRTCSALWHSWSSTALKDWEIS